MENYKAIENQEVLGKRVDYAWCALMVIIHKMKDVI